MLALCLIKTPEPVVSEGSGVSCAYILYLTTGRLAVCSHVFSVVL